MTAFAKALLAGAAISLLAAAAGAQGVAHEFQRPTPVSRDRIQQFEAAHAAALRRAWLAAGHADEPPSRSPAILSGKILTPNLTVGRGTGAPEFRVKFKTGGSGLSYIGAYFDAPVGSTDVYVLYNTPYKAPSMTAGVLQISDPGNGYGSGALNPYSPSGTWKLAALYIGDRGGNYTSYSAAQLATMFPSLTVQVTNRGKPDITPPTVSDGKILTPTVSLSAGNAVFAASVFVTDDVSGVRMGYVEVQPPTGDSTGCCNYPPAPIVKGRMTLDAYLGDSPATGTWTITEYEACDVAGNCNYHSDATAIQALFGTTTFKVTK